VKVEQIPAEIQKPAPVEVKKEAPPKVEPPEILPDYSDIDLEVLLVRRLEESFRPYNSSSPRFSSNEQWIAYEANHEMLKKIYIYEISARALALDNKSAFKRVREVYLEEGFGEAFSEDLFESSLQESFNYEFSWFPESSSFIFTSNAGMGEYNLFVGAIDGKDRILNDIVSRLEPKQFGSYYMMTNEVSKDGQARVSPDGQRIVFTSGRTGNGDLYLLDLGTGTLQRLTVSAETDLFPQWAPDSNDIVYTTGGKHSHDIHVIRDAGTEEQSDEVLVQWFFDDVMPVYSPDGKWISFYTTYNIERDPFNTKRWGVIIIPSDGTAPKSGMELISYFHSSDVVKDSSQGIAWFPDSNHILYAKNIDTDYNPIYIYTVETREERLIETGTTINHDITVSPHGLISFRAQVLGWDRIFLASTTYFQKYVELNSRKFGEE
jgi:Tol biopolymer transport system component